MKKYTFYKTLQLILFLAVTIAVLAWIFPQTDVYHLVAQNATTRLLAATLWLVMLLVFVFIFLDYAYFFDYRKEYKEMDLAVHSDPLTGIANRFSCDILIEKYVDKNLPDHVGCIMLNMTNIQDINRLYGHLQGNMAIRDFSNILRLCSSELCFVGRNGGNKFLAIFEDCDEEKMQLFLDRVDQRVTNHNRDVVNAPLTYCVGSALQSTDRTKGITELVSLANDRMTAAEADTSRKN